MVKLYCNRCGKEIKNEYYTIIFYSYDADPKSDVYDWATACCSSSSSYTRDSALQVLNSQTMYCKKCKCEIENFISNKE